MVLAFLFLCAAFATVTICLQTSHAADKMKLIIDTDGVSDDVRAISLALNQENVEVIAITTTHGCTNVRQASANVARTLRANTKKVSIYKGASGPLLKQENPVNMSFLFGQDGISDRPDVEPKVLEEDLSSSWVSDESAAVALIRLTRENPGTTIVCLGPLTNVALAIKLDDNFVRQPKKLVIMGGNYYGIGNVDAFSSAESNFYGDPEAASIVLSEMESPITIVPWEPFIMHQKKYENAVDFNENLEAGTPLANLLKAAFSVPRAVMAKSNSSYSYCDEVAVAIAIYPEKTLLDKKELRVSVELAGKFTRGQVVPDWVGEESKEGDANCRRPLTFLTDYKMSSDKMKLIIDTDGVVDDIRAISLALNQPNVEVLAITTTHGCVSVQQAAANVARTLRANKKSVPIYKGASVAILKPNPPIDESFFFGQDGLGDLPEVEPTVLPTDLTSSWVPEEAAALALIRLTREHPDTVLACIGPITNVALAIKLDDNFVRQPKKLVIMGGNYFGVGNVNSFSSAEFNFFGDPEAASIVLSEMESPITIVPWEAFFIHNANYEKEVNFHAHLDFGTPLAEYFKAATSIGRAELEKSGRQYGYCDEIAVATAIAPEKTIKDKKIMRVSVELAGKFSRGQVVPDWIGQLWQNEECGRQPDKSRPPITFVTDYDVHYVDQLICDMVRNSK